MQLLWRHDSSWRLRPFCAADRLAVSSWGRLHDSPTYRAVLEFDGVMHGVASIECDQRSGKIGEILISPACSRLNCMRLLRDVCLRFPTQVGLGSVDVVLELGTPIEGQSTAYAIQQCEWGALNDSIQAVLMDLGYLILSVEASCLRLRWRNPTH
jgi:hypothetical protein